MTTVELARDFALALIAKSGVREYEQPEVIEAIGNAAWQLATFLNGDDMAVTAVFRTQSGTAKTLKSSGGSAVITLAPSGVGLVSGAMRQSGSLDLGVTRAARYRMEVAYELASTPTAGAAINHFGSWSDTTGAGQANTTGSDASYSGYSSNAAASVKELEFLGSHLCTTQVTSTVQKSFVGIVVPKARFLNLVVDNESGAAFHTSDANCVITLTPIEDTAEPS